MSVASPIPRDGSPVRGMSLPPFAGTFAGLPMTGVTVMGIVNITPDSFSDGGRHFAVDDAIAAGFRMAEAGAKILDVGGESTRPGAAAVSPEEEIRRVVPVIRALAERGLIVSIDTRHAAVMDAAVGAGAAIINDIAALTGDPDSLATAARLKVPVVLMHMQGDPQTMQASPHYEDVVTEVYTYLAGRIAACVAAGIPLSHICVDPGIGFGKTVADNVALLANLSAFHGLGCPVLLGASRKSFIAGLAPSQGPQDRLAGSLAAVLAGAAQGVQIVRVHDVAETVQALAVWTAIQKKNEE